MPESTRDLILEHRLKPLPGTLIARIDKVQTKGRIILPITAQYETSTATITAIGPELPDYLQPDIRILPHEQSGREIYEGDNARYVLYKLSDIQAAFIDPTEEQLKSYFEDHEVKPL